MSEELYCVLCGYTATTKSNFKKHLVTKKHLAKLAEGGRESTKYFCEACNYVTDKKQRMEMHMESKRHLKGKIKLMECECCKYSAGDATNFARHLKTKAHKKAFARANCTSEKSVVSLENTLYEECVAKVTPFSINPKEKDAKVREDIITIWGDIPLGKELFPFFVWMKKSVELADISVQESGEFCCSIKKNKHEYILSKERFFMAVLVVAERLHFFCKRKAAEEFESWLSLGYEEKTGPYQARQSQKGWLQYHKIFEVRGM
ncbi:zinc finger protein [Golden Marseillevirus]|uniref:zinc finger protein n=1 Tax=Golden Marseillevirus TaxID=1720526 RepID=UPI000877A884|nr:zinc finger protein [Golden Marseillevirus]ALX27593.1 zinc finger protein [Golden Marseillevirus]